MKRILLVALATFAVSIPAAFASSPVNGTDRANGARACNTLRTALGATTFNHTYATFGSCVSAWTAKAHADRVAATTACQAQGLKGKKLQSCISSQVASTLSTQVSATKNAAKACAAELKTMGATAFEKQYGKNGNLRNAFGKCVSSKASSKNNGGGSGGSSGQGAKHYAVTLSALNGSGASGSGTLLLNANQLIVKLTISGLESGQQHAVAIRGLSAGSASCPTAAADTNNDGMISLSEGQPFFGDVLLALDQAAQSGQAQTVSSSLSPLQTRTIVVLGKTVNGTYDATLPVACGTITTS